MKCAVLTGRTAHPEDVSVVGVFETVEDAQEKVEELLAEHYEDDRFNWKEFDIDEFSEFSDTDEIRCLWRQVGEDWKEMLVEIPEELAKLLDEAGL